MTATENSTKSPLNHCDTQLMLQIIRTAAMIEHAIDEALKPCGLTHTQYMVLSILHTAEPAGLCGRAIGDQLPCPVPDIPRLLERMADAGLIWRERDPHDRRHMTAHLTDSGRHCLALATPRLDELAQHWFDRLDTGLPMARAALQLLVLAR